MIVATFVLNVADAVLTLHWIFGGHAAEANPLMDRLIHMDPTVFMTTKLMLVALGSVLLWRLRERRAAVFAIFALFLTYYFLLLWHLDALELRLLRRWFS